MVPLRHFRILGPILLAVLVLQGCQNPSMVPVVGAGRAPPYMVKEGDTLYAIAALHGIDYRDLARRNNIPSPFVIFPGQTLKLVGRAVPEKDSALLQSRIQTARNRIARNPKERITVVKHRALQ